MFQHRFDLAGSYTSIIRPGNVYNNEMALPVLWMNGRPFRVEELVGIDAVHRQERLTTLLRFAKRIQKH